MKVSFYFVLWLLACMPSILLDIPFLDKYGFLFALVIVILTDVIVGKLLKKQIVYQRSCERIAIMEMAYNNDYKQYKRQVSLMMIACTLNFVCVLLIFIAMFLLFSDVPLIDYILLGVFTLWAGLAFLYHIISYIKVVKDGKIVLNKRDADLFMEYKAERDKYTLEEMLQPYRPKYYKAMNVANSIFAVLSIIIGLLTFAHLYAFRGELISDAELIGTSLIIYGVLAVYFGIKDLLNTSNSQKYLLLLFSCILAALLYMPLINYCNKNILTAYIGGYSSLSYDAKSNLVQETIRVNDIENFDYTVQRKYSILKLSEEGMKELLRKIIRVNAEYHVVYRDSLGKEQVITIAPSELKEIYHQTKSELDILLERLKLFLDRIDALDEGATNVYDDGKYIFIEMTPNYPAQTSGDEIFSLIVNSIKECFNVADFGRGLKVRMFYDNNQFNECILSLEDLTKEKEDADKMR